MADQSQRTTDEELVVFFSAFDDIIASDELKDATLAAIFAQMDDKKAQEPQLRLVEHPTTATVQPTTTVTPGGRETDTPTLTAIDNGRNGTRMTANQPQLKAVEGGNIAARKTARRHGMRLRMAAAIIAVSVVAAGGVVAYAVPASHVQVTEGGTTVDLGVNVFGMTVAADAKTDEGRAILANLNLRNRGFEDALDSVIGRMSGRGEGNGSVNVQIESPFGAQRNDLESNAVRVLDNHGLERGDGGRAATTPEATPKGVDAGNTTAGDDSGIERRMDVDAGRTYSDVRQQDVGGNPQSNEVIDRQQGDTNMGGGPVGMDAQSVADTRVPPGAGDDASGNRDARSDDGGPGDR